MIISLMAARSDNNVIGNNAEIPWKAEGEQLLFKAMTYNHWLLVGRKTFEAMGMLPDRKYAVVSSSLKEQISEDVCFFKSVDAALGYLSDKTGLVIVSGGGQIYAETISRVDVIHLSVIHCEAKGNVFFPAIPEKFKMVFSQDFRSNIDYTYQIWTR
ncbi:MAG: dihydrofolate reductase [Deltaproteobacteria bacterium]|nr:dihydrofolate reductase [Deltaproteobacteria bacterium]